MIEIFISSPVIIRHGPKHILITMEDDLQISNIRFYSPTTTFNTTKGDEWTYVTAKYTIS